MISHNQFSKNRYCLFRSSSRLGLKIAARFAAATLLKCLFMQKLFPITPSLLRFGVFVFGMNGLRTELPAVAGNAEIAQMTTTLKYAPWIERTGWESLLRRAAVSTCQNLCLLLQTLLATASARRGTWLQQCHPPGLQNA